MALKRAMVKPIKKNWSTILAAPFQPFEKIKTLTMICLLWIQLHTLTEANVRQMEMETSQKYDGVTTNTQQTQESLSREVIHEVVSH